ncbi:major facilitator superfamily domain-containing protein [Bisporella sp. PMI_857]|nr:major facilitator superfamily domain-containing protein [Bisporella sp. PMI_857]
MQPTNHTTGTVQLFDSKRVVLIPTPSRDPKDPLNLPEWRKNLIVLIIGLFSAFAVLATAGMGAIATEVMAMYPGEETRVTDLLTYPTVFMGIGNIIAMPACVAIGRRPVFLGSLLTMVLSGIWCACSKSLGSHIAGRNILSLAAGQSEALTAYMVQEIHFVHQRGTKGTWNAVIQGTVSGAMFVATTYLVPALGVRWWYGIMTIINFAILIAAFVFVPETMYDRVVEDFGMDKGDPHVEADGTKVMQVTTTATNTLDPDRYGPRTWKTDLTVFHFKPRWHEMLKFYKVVAQAFCTPTILWLLCVNGAFLGIFVFHSSTFAGVLMSPPYNFKVETLGFVQLALVLVNFIVLPVVGYGSDWVIKLMSRMNKGVYEPEYRFFGLILPACAAVIACVIYGRAAEHPASWNWSAIAIPYAMGLFSFMGANTVGITYAVDSWPLEAGAILLVIAAGRGFISFGLSYATVPWVKKNGYDGAMNDFAIVCGVFSLLGLPVYFFGKRIRLWTQKHFWPLE